MAVVNPPFAIQARADHPARLFRELLASLRGQAGVIAAADMAVVQNGTPNMSVNVGSGKAVVDGSQSFAAQGSYLVYNDATVNLTIAAADATNPRNDLVVAQVRDAEYSGANNDWLLTVIQGTPAPSPVDPAVPVNSLILARVRVNANASSIVNGNITDLRPQGVIVNIATPTQQTTGTGVIGTQGTAARSDHQHATILRARSVQTAITALALTQGTWISFGTAMTITPAVNSVVLVWIDISGVFSINSTVYLRALFNGGSGDRGVGGVAIRDDAAGYRTAVYHDTFTGLGSIAVQAQLNCDNSGTWTPRAAPAVHMSMLAIAIPV